MGYPGEIMTFFPCFYFWSVNKPYYLQGGMTTYFDKYNPNTYILEVLMNNTIDALHSIPCLVSFFLN